VEPSTAGAVILGFDSATDDSTVAVTRDGEVLTEWRADGHGGERPRHANELLPHIVEAVDAAGGWGAVDALAVGVGPGAFTGLRVGVATARSLAQALGKPLAPVVSLAALAAGMGERPAAVGRPRLAAIDARRGELFAALYDPHGTPVWEPFVAPPAAIAERLTELGERPLAAGSGSLRFRQELEAKGIEVLADDEPAHRIWARFVCRLASAVTPVAPEAVEPIYLRRPDAELWRERDRDGGQSA
jgi:tRNA threonylcarbamoyladenosine biosynthesis protein TsaB